MSTQPPPKTVPIAQVLDQNAPLVRLMQRVRESRERFAAIEPVLPPPLRRSVVPGPVDEAGWTLLARNAAVAAKLRHLLPRLEDHLRQAGFRAVALKVKVENPA